MVRLKDLLNGICPGEKVYVTVEAERNLDIILYEGYGYEEAYEYAEKHPNCYLIQIKAKPRMTKGYYFDIECYLKERRDK